MVRALHHAHSHAAHPRHVIEVVGAGDIAQRLDLGEALGMIAGAHQGRRQIHALAQSAWVPDIT